MAIDPLMYEKYSGRKGDAAGRMGAALAQSSKRKSELRAAKESHEANPTVSKWRFFRAFGMLGRLFGR